MIECEVKINNFDYKIKIVEPNNENLLMPDGNYHHGVTRFKKKEIYIMEDLPQATRDFTLRHELTHAFIDAYGLLQVDWDDEIVADFIGVYYPNITKALNEIYDKLNKKERKICKRT